MVGRIGYFGISWMALALVVTQPVAHAGECPCNADVDNNGVLNVTDGAIVSSCANNGGGMDCPSCVNSCDVDCNGAVDRTDFSMVYCQQILGPDADCCNLPVGACTGLAESVHGWCAMYHEEVCAEYPSTTYHGDNVSCASLLPTPQPNPDGLNRARFISFRMHPASEGTLTALRVELTSIATPPGPPASGSMVRWVNAVGFNGSNHGVMPIVLGDVPPNCPAQYAGATLGCEPEYRDWAGEVNGIVGGDGALYVLSQATVPSSIYTVTHVSKSGAESDSLQVSTGLWVDAAAPFGIVSVLDFSAIRNYLMGLGAPCKSFAWMKASGPQNPTIPINVLDLAQVSNFKGTGAGYPASALIPTCP